MSGQGIAAQQRGVGILMALMVVAVVASVIAGVAVMTHYSVRRSGVIAHLQQAESYNDGLLLYAQRLLQMDALSTKYDSLHEDWATLKPAFPVDGGQVSGHINELSSRFNLAGLRINDPFEEKVFKRLFHRLSASTAQAERVIHSVRSGLVADVIGAFVAAELDEDLIYRLAEYFCFLPINAEKLNLNVVSPAVLAAYLNMSEARAQEILRQRLQKPLTSQKDLLDFANRHAIGQIGIDALKQNSPSIIELRFGVKSRYFQLVGETQVGNARAVTVAVVDRSGSQLILLSKRFSKLPAE